MRFKDMVVPLKIIYDSEIKSKNISVSLDPNIPTDPDGPEYAKVYYPKELYNFTNFSFHRKIFFYQYYLT
jgi:hypothetical protein